MITHESINRAIDYILQNIEDTTLEKAAAGAECFSQKQYL